jgi:hypothetical protein
MAIKLAWAVLFLLLAYLAFTVGLFIYFDELLGLFIKSKIL